ncbi:MAG: tRNA glutamyl-Q(34) synthetase GluQRS [Oscillospiraceae bacterium]|nr:tRNA glutamyl-Q(34) synthetase GluQRS [Oscillospiraceae bacterium]
MAEAVRGRFAPSPSGRMHLGNVSSALLAWCSVRAQRGAMVLRLEDLDGERCKSAYSDFLIEDLQWLGLDWDEGPLTGGGCGPYRQSECGPLYEEALRTLEAKGLLYPCWCTRAQRLAAAPHGAEAAEGRCPCYALTEAERAARLAQRPRGVRVLAPDESFTVEDGLQGLFSQNLRHDCGDFLLRRSDGMWAYQLAVCVDDGRMGVTEVVRGRDLLSSTPRQMFLLRELGYEPPRYIHTPLLLAPDGRRLSKRERDLDMAALREALTPERLVGKLAFLLGLTGREYPVTARELAADFNWSRVTAADAVLRGI